MWKRRMSIFKVSSENRNKAKEQKEPELSFDVCKIECGKWKRGRLSWNLIKRSGAKRAEVTELYFFYYNDQNQLASILLIQSSSC